MPANQEPDPHGYVAQGTELSRKYLARQYWNLKWLTLVLSGSMTAITITSSTWVVPMNLITWVMAMMMYWMGVGTLRNMFIASLRAARAGKETELQNFNKAIPMVTWGLYFLQVVMFYWVLIICWLSFFAEIPAQG